MPGFNPMDELLRLTFHWNQIKPAPRNHQILPQSEDAIRNGIAMMMIVKEPGAKLALSKSRLNGVEIHGSHFKSRLRERYRRRGDGVPSGRRCCGCWGVGSRWVSRSGATAARRAFAYHRLPPPVTAAGHAIFLSTNAEFFE